MIRRIGLALCVLALAGCGGGSHKTACSPAVTRALAHLDRDVAAIRKAAALPTKSTLDGNPAVNRATDRFLRDVFTLPIDNLTRNREIDHAAAALAGSCTQCFQALEADRPIITIRFRGGTPKARCERARSS